MKKLSSYSNLFHQLLKFPFGGFRGLLFIFLTFATLVSFAQKHVDLYRAGVFDKSYSTIDSAIKAANFTGDSLVLSAHTFYETLLYSKTKIIALQGTVTTTDTTTIDAGGKAEYIIDHRGTGSIRDIIFQNGKTFPIYFNGGLSSDTIIIGGNTIVRNFNILPNLNYLFEGTTRNVILEGHVKIINNFCSKIIRCFYLSMKDNVLIDNNYSSTLFNPYLGFIDAPEFGLSITGKVRITNNTSDSTYTAGICIIDRGSPVDIYIGDSVTISNNISSTGLGRGGAICFGNSPMPYSPTTKTIYLGATDFSNNQANLGGAIYCEDSSIRLVFNGTRFSKNKAKYGGAIYTSGSLDIKNANFTDNEADSGASIFINTKVGAPTTPLLTVSGSRFYNSLLPANKQNHIYATYTPLTALPPSINLNGNWWGKSDTIGVLRENPKGLSNLGYWAVANWSVKGGTAVVAGDTTFPVAAEIKYNHGISFPASSFGLLKGIFKTDTGTFTPTVSPINSSNMVSSTFRTYKDSALTSTTAHFVASIDADTFRKTQIVWSKDTLVNVGITTKNKLPNIFIYPNPVKDFLHLEGALSSSKIRVYDLQGKVAASSDVPNDLYLGHLPAGQYLVEVRQPDGSVGTAKVEKE